MARSTKITKRCTRTGFEVTGSEREIAKFFYRDKSQKDGFSPWSKEAERAYNKEYRARKNAGDEKQAVVSKAKGKKQTATKPRSRKRTTKAA
jgi:hypothetical protein